MKKIMNKINFAVLGIMASVPAFAAANGLCELITKLQETFKILRTLAFVGAAFYIAGWAWAYISKGEAKLEDVKKQGIGLLVGYTLLFIIGIVLSAVLAAAGQGGALECPVDKGW